MGGSQKIKDYLEKQKITFQVLQHDTAYSAMEIAGAQHVPGRQFVKSVIVNADGKYVMCVLPAIHMIDLEKLKILIGAQIVSLVNEKEVAKLFPNDEVGAEPPLDLPSGMKLYVDKILEENDEIAFNAGTHTDIIKIKFKDFVKLTKPTILDFGVHINKARL